MSYSYGWCWRRAKSHQVRGRIGKGRPSKRTAHRIFNDSAMHLMKRLCDKDLDEKLISRFFPPDFGSAVQVDSGKSWRSVEPHTQHFRWTLKALKNIDRDRNKRLWAIKQRLYTEAKRNTQTSDSWHIWKKRKEKENEKVANIFGQHEHAWSPFEPLTTCHERKGGEVMAKSPNNAHIHVRAKSEKKQ